MVSRTSVPAPRPAGASSQSGGPPSISSSSRSRASACARALQVDATGGEGVLLETGDGADLEQGAYVLATGGKRSALWIDLPAGGSDQ